MSSYEKQMQWKKAASEKAKKHLDAREAETAHSFAPVFYTQSSSKSNRENRAHEEEMPHSSSKSRSQRSKDGSSSKQNNGNNAASSYREGDVVYGSPAGAASINSHAHSQYTETSAMDAEGYSRSYSELHQHEHASHRADGGSGGHRHAQSHHRSSSGGRNQRSDRGAQRHTHDIAEGDDEEASHSAEDSAHNSRTRGGSNRPPPAPSSSAVGAYSSNGRHLAQCSEERRQTGSEHRSRHHHRHHHHRERSHSASSRSDSRSSSSGSGSGDRDSRERNRDRDRERSKDMRRSGRSTHRKRLDSAEESASEAEEPIIELLERERKQWREERQQLIQCIHLQQLELAQRSAAAHERAADIAKEFARAIECFEERLVIAESTVSNEMLFMRSISETLLRAATSSAGANSAGTGAASTALTTQQRST